jgi:hypothetical protein
VWLLFVSPIHEFPISDDWAYAQSVRHFLNTGEVHISDWASTTLVFQIYWGALFAKILGGFSFSALRLSTLVMSFIGCYALYDLLCQYELAPTEALLGAVVLAVNPIYIYLSYTFLSDIFLFGLMLVSSTLYVRGVKRESNGFLLAGSVCAAAAYLARQLGILLPLGLAATLLLSAKHRKLSFIGSACLIPLVVFAIHNYWLRYLHGYPWAFTFNALTNSWLWVLRSQAPFDLITRTFFSACYIGLYGLPIILIAITQKYWKTTGYKLWLIIFGALFALVGLSTQHPMPYLADASNLSGLGDKEVVTPLWMFWLITFIAPFVGAGQVSILGNQISQGWKHWGNLSRPLVLANIMMAGLTLPAIALWDRYLLVFLPLAFYFVLKSVSWNYPNRIISVAGCALMLVYGLVTISDYLSWNEARWKVGRELIQQGIPAEKINGGFEWIGWYEFETVFSAVPVGNTNALLNWATATPKEYLLVFRPNPEYELVRQVPYQSLLWKGNVYVLRNNK